MSSEAKIAKLFLELGHFKGIVVKYGEMSLRVCDAITLGELNIDQALVEKVFLKNSRDDVYRSIEGVKFFFNWDNYRSEETTFEDFSRHIFTLSEYLSDFSNSILFRTYTNSSGRKINRLNSRLGIFYTSEIKRIFNEFTDYFNRRIDKDLVSSYSTENFSYHNCGFKEDIDNKKAAMLHYENKHVQSIDISKFFENVTTYKFITQNIFADAVEHIYGSLSENDLLESAHSKMKKVLVAFLNNAILFLTHNGKVPTGSSYSPVLSNIFMANFDFVVLDELQEKIIDENNSDLKYCITRYVDDITISCNEIRDDNGLKDKRIISVIESLLNEKRLFLKYEKTVTFERDKNNAVVLGISLPKIGNEVVSVAAKQRTSVLEAVRSVPLEEIDIAGMGKISYYINSPNGYAAYDVLFNNMIDMKKDALREFLIEMYGNLYQYKGIYSAKDAAYFMNSKNKSIFYLDDEHNLVEDLSVKESILPLLKFMVGINIPDESFLLYEKDSSLFFKIKVKDLSGLPHNYKTIFKCINTKDSLIGIDPLIVGGLDKLNES